MYVSDKSLSHEAVKESIEWVTVRSGPTDFVLRGYCTSYLKLACFVLHLKIINTFMKNNKWILQKIVQGTQNLTRPSGS